MLLLLLACSEPPAPAPLVDVDTLPGRRTLSASGAIEAIVAPGGALRVRSGTNERALDTRVDPRLAISVDDSLLIYTRETDEVAGALVGLAKGGRQLTNFKVERRPGQPPDGWIPVPDGTTYTWTEAGLSWVAESQRWSVTP